MLIIAKGLKKEKDISTSSIVEQFREIVPYLEKEYGVVLHLSQIFGERWAYVTGTKVFEIPGELPERIRLNQDLGVIIYNWHNIDEDKKDELIASLADLGK